MRVERAELDQQRQPILELLTHADDPSAAHLDSCDPQVPEGRQPIVEGMRGDNRGIVLAGRIEVVVVGIEASLFEAERLLGRQHAEGDARLESFGLDPPDHLQDSLEGRALFRAPPGSTHTETGRAFGLRLPSRLDHFGHLHHRFGSERPVVRRLGTVSAVLLATARFDTEQRAELDLVLGLMREVHGSCAIDQVEERKGVEGLDFLEREVMTVRHEGRI